jgi:hypothetical protein
VQLVAHFACVPLAQRPFEQVLVPAVVQVPVPLQTEAVVIDPLLQLAGVQIVASLGNAQAWVWVPSHCPLHGVVPAHAGRGASGVPCVGVQIPR